VTKMTRITSALAIAAAGVMLLSTPVLAEAGEVQTSADSVQLDEQEVADPMQFDEEEIAD
jgi:hypothetical protein